MDAKRVTIPAAMKAEILALVRSNEFAKKNVPAAFVLWLERLRSVSAALSKAEREAILKVPTSPEQAVRIALRNLWLLWSEPEVARINVGCPHCWYKSPSGFQCGNCAWQHYPGAEFKYMACTEAQFGGSLLDEVSDSVAYGFDYEYIDEPKGAPENRFLNGHVEWAIAAWRAKQTAWVRPTETRI